MYRPKKSLKACILHVPGGIEPPNINGFPGTYCNKRTKPAPLTEFQTIFGIFHFSLLYCRFTKVFAIKPNRCHLTRGVS